MYSGLLHRFLYTGLNVLAIHWINFDLSLLHVFVQGVFENIFKNIKMCQFVGLGGKLPYSNEIFEGVIFNILLIKQRTTQCEPIVVIYYKNVQLVQGIFFFNNDRTWKQRDGGWLLKIKKKKKGERTSLASTAVKHFEHRMFVMMSDKWKMTWECSKVLPVLDYLQGCQRKF